jgi:endonuclease/exonuclease/phosphatase family metal-dependent hydrolase
VPRDDTALTAMTLNIWGEEQWQERRYAIVAWINEIRPDLVALQEIVRTRKSCEAVWLAEETGMTATFAAANKLTDHEFGNAVLSRWPILDVRSRILVDAPSPAETRGMLTVDVRANGRVVSFTSTHLSYRRTEGWIREAQVREIADAVGSGRAGFPPIVCGDFNARPDSTEVRFLKGLHAFDRQSFHLTDAYEVAHPDGLGFTWSNANPFTAANNVPDRRIDYIFVGPAAKDGAGRVVDARVVCDEPRHGVWPSDHFGVAATLACPRRDDELS